MTQKDADIISVAMVFVVVELLVAWLLLSVVTGNGSDAWILLLIAIFLLAVIGFLRLYWAYTGVNIPFGLCGVTYRGKTAIKAVPGPATLHTIPLFTNAGVVQLDQSPLDVLVACTTRDQKEVNIAIAIFYSIRIDSLVEHLNEQIDVVGTLKRYAGSKLNQDVASCDLANIGTVVPGAIRQLRTYLMNPVNGHYHYDIQNVLLMGVGGPAKSSSSLSNEESVGETGNQSKSSFTFARAAVPFSGIDAVALKDWLLRYFGNKEELEVLCHDTQNALKRDGVMVRLNPDILGNGGLEVLHVRLMDYLEQRGLLKYLIEEARRLRPGVAWIE